MNIKAGLCCQQIPNRDLETLTASDVSNKAHGRNHGDDHPSYPQKIWVVGQIELGAVDQYSRAPSARDCTRGGDQSRNAPIIEIQPQAIRIPKPHAHQEAILLAVICAEAAR